MSGGSEATTEYSVILHDICPRLPSGEMPAVPLRLPSPSRALSTPPNPLPGLLHTPAGLAVIEIQGSLHLPSALDAHSAQPLSTGTTKVGKLVFPLLANQDLRDPDEKPSSDAWMKRIYLYVGQYQRMTGEVRKLVKPLAIVRKRSGGDCGSSSATITASTHAATTATSTTSTTSTTTTASTSVGQVGSAEGEDLEVVELVNYKLVFSHRPEPVGVEDSAMFPSIT